MDEGVVKRSGSIWAPRVTARRIAIWTSLALVCLAALAALLLMQSIERQIGDVIARHALRMSAQDLALDLSQAEASQRGYLLSGDPQLRDRHEQARRDARQKLDALQAMVAGDADRSRAVDAIGDVAAQAMAGMAAAIERGPVGGTAQTAMQNGSLGDAIAALEGFIAEEEANLATRNAEIDNTRIILVGVLIAALVASVALAYALLSRTQRQVSALSRSHQGLVSQNEALEALVAERVREIDEARAHAEREQLRVETLLRDTNHRVGNSLATVSSLLALQVMRSQSSEVREALEAARLRIHAIASAHRRLRLGDDMESASAQDFLSTVIEDIGKAQPESHNIVLTSEIEPINVSSRDATTLGILVGELVTNAIKHGFADGRPGSVVVKLSRDADGVPLLRVRDDGIGMAGDQMVSEGGLGSLIVRQLASQFGGEPHYQRPPTGGVEVNISLPVLLQVRHFPVES